MKIALGCAMPSISNDGMRVLATCRYSVERLSMAIEICLLWISITSVALFFLTSKGFAQDDVREMVEALEGLEVHHFVPGEELIRKGSNYKTGYSNGVIDAIEMMQVLQGMGFSGVDISICLENWSAPVVKALTERHLHSADADLNQSGAVLVYQALGADCLLELDRLIDPDPEPTE